MDSSIKNDTDVSDAYIPIYVKFLDNFFMATIVIPICCWILFLLYFKDIPEPDYERVLNILWAVSVPFFFTIWALEGACVLLLKWSGITIFDKHQDGGNIFKIGNVYKKLSQVNKRNKILILYVMHSRFSIMLVMGWVVFGGIIKFFAINSY